jgi:hypothetical protein
MKYRILASLIIPVFPLSLLAQKGLAELKFVSIHSTPIIGKGHKGAEDVKFGFEGGTAQKVKGVYYLFVTEVADTPKTAQVRMAIWSSKDGIKFQKRGIIAKSNGDWYDSTHRMATWSPMSVFDAERNVWSVFSVGYRRKPDATNVYNMSGRILRHDSKVKGIDGIAGPYQEGGWLNVDKKPEWWEGPGELVSFFPYKIGNEWWAFYGGNSVPEHVEAAATINPNAKNVFYNGLMKAEKGLTGKWVRQSKLSPVPMDPEFVENCISTKVAPNLYIAVYDGANEKEISYSCSKDGKHWEKEQLIKIPNAPSWIKEYKNTAGTYQRRQRFVHNLLHAFDGDNPDKIEPLWHDGFGNLGKMTVRLVTK